MAEINIYAGLAINGFFTGLGVIIANAFYDAIIKPKLVKIHKRLKKARLA